MTRKLIAPGVTGGEWRVDETSIGPEIVSGEEIIAWSNYGDLDMLVESITPANARFLAGSKRVSEAAARLDTELRRALTWDGFDSQTYKAIDDLRAALIAQGYKESDG